MAEYGGLQGILGLVVVVLIVALIAFTATWWAKHHQGGVEEPEEDIEFFAEHAFNKRPYDWAKNGI